MIRVPITLTETDEIERINEPVSISIPFANNAISNENALFLLNDDGAVIARQLTVFSRWPNQSIKWLRVHFQHSLQKNEHTTLFLTEDNNSLPPNQNTKNLLNIAVSETSQCITIDTGKATFQLDKTELGVFAPDAVLNTNTACTEGKNNYLSQDNSLRLTDNNAIEYYPCIEQINFKPSKLNAVNRQLQLTVNVLGYFKSKQQQSPVRFSADITFYANKEYSQWRFVLHNPNSMVHNSGKWDLGNENSCYFQSFEALVFADNHSALEYKTQPKNVWQSCSADDFLIFQASSGGKNWQSENHVDRFNKVPLMFNGYRLSTSDSKSELESDIATKRATPSVSLQQHHNNNHTENITVHIENFWQKFPKSIEIQTNALVLGLFPQQAKHGFELQPGEKKSDVFYLSFSAEQNSLTQAESPIEVTIASQYFTTSKAISLLSNTANEKIYNDIVASGLHSDNNFFNKRELIDEFGWRNFGDLYADHETLEVSGNDELISHYNNQYDPLFGLLKQYLHTNNRQWLTLANDLADHVSNIDIYHTEQDKAEYNGGLFWHTDHYLPAETASHRTYSQHQQSNAYQDHAGGGGPGGQHCYTNGLMLHYFLTGDERSKQAVLQLTHWITRVYEGSGTLTDFLLAIKNKNRVDVKNIFTGKYPLDRGTGHYIIALIDAYELTQKQSYLDQASLVIKKTIAPNDDIEERALSNVEACWFYTIFFQAVYRYLLVKENHSQLDSSFYYAKACLLHYAQWMVTNEQPYLYKPEILEYPNLTWAAQDIRKASVLYMASYFADKETTQLAMRNKADDIYNYVMNTFKDESTRSFTRILSILMQNHGIQSFVKSQKDILKNRNLQTFAKEYYPIESKNNKLLDNFMDTLSNTSVNKELLCLRNRSKSIDSLLNKIGL